jgi:hypothetical protein
MMRVTHNLRAPLSAMISILDTVRGGYLGTLSDSQREYLRRLDRRARSMLTMINELMTLAESRGVKAARADQPVDLLALATRIRRTFENEAAEKQLLFRVTTPEELPSIQGDPNLVEQMLENLVSNAIKYTASGGRVEVTFARAQRTVRMEVSDTGIGIPKEEMPNLFKEFFRAENARSVETVGTGLGLAIVKEIVDKHGGRVLVESEPGLGTLFVVHLPLTRTRGQDPSGPVPDQESGTPPTSSPGKDATTIAWRVLAAEESVRQSFRTTRGPSATKRRSGLLSATFTFLRKRFARRMDKRVPLGSGGREVLGRERPEFPGREAYFYRTLSDEG